jgi:hypothetical protein
LIKFDLPSKETKTVEKEFQNNNDYIRTTISPLKEYSNNVDCECLENGQFIKDRINYMKPMSIGNKRKIYRDYSIRL